LIDPHAELTPGLRAWYYRNKPILSEIGVWIPVAAYLVFVSVIIFPIVKDNPPGLILRNAAKVHVSQLLPMYGMIMHLVGLGVLSFGAFKRRLGTSVRYSLTLQGLASAMLASYSYIQLTGPVAKVSEEGLIMSYTYSVFSLVWVALAIWKIRITLVEVATA
jgi:hypothetical protein